MTSHQRPSHDCADLSVPRYVRCRNSHCKHPRASWRALSPRIIYRFRPLRVCRTVPRLATGTLRFSYPQTLPGYASACRSVPVATLASASLPEASVRVRSSVEPPACSRRAGGYSPVFRLGSLTRLPGREPCPKKQILLDMGTSKPALAT